MKKSKKTKYLCPKTGLMWSMHKSVTEYNI